LWKCTEWVLISEQSHDAAVVNWLIEVCLLADKLWLSCVQAGTGIAEILSLEINRQGKHTLEEARKKIYLVDSKVIIFRNVFSNSHSVVSLAH
jgi:hypothetical protein